MTERAPDQARTDSVRARVARLAEAAERRAAEAEDAVHFLTEGHDAHVGHCIHAEPCSRNYDPGEEPFHPALYEGTGIAALFALPGGERYAWQLAGWNLRRETA